MLFTEEQVATLVTDAGSLKRGQELAGPAKWSQLGQSDVALWGACAGSGSKPYLTGVDLTGPAFKCSCPSRVFPCKHGVGLLLLFARQPQLLPAGTPPSWLAEWLEKRQTKAELPAPKASQAEEAVDLAVPTPSESASRDKREAQRTARRQAGAADLEAWLTDLIRAGLADLENKPRSYWEGQAARLVDSQLPGLAATLRELGEQPRVGANWTSRLLGRLGELYLLLRAFRNVETLPPAARQELLQQVGVNLKKEALLADPTTSKVTDHWLVLGQFSWEEVRLTARRTWLRGLRSGRYALILEFAFGGQPFATPLVSGGRYVGELTFYPGLLPLRAVTTGLTFKESMPAMAPPGGPPNQLLDDYANALALHPWLREWPATLTQIQPVRQLDGSWLLYHTTESGAIPLRFADDNAPWQLLAQSGGQPITLFGEWDGRAFRPLGSWVEGATAGATAEEPRHQPAAPNQEASSALTPEQLPAWPQVLRSALLGTRQSGESTAVIHSISTPTDSPEQRLLLAAGTVALVQKAGFVPPAQATPLPHPAPAESWEPLGRLGTECLRELLSSNRYAVFRTDYWAQLQQHQRLVPASLLVLALQTESFRTHLPGPLSATLGERGHWLTQQNPDWHPLLAATNSPLDLDTWETGTLQQRRFFLEQRHKSDPEEARQLLATTLPTEPAATQATLLSALERSVQPADAPLLETYLVARSKEVRQTVVPLLARLPHSALVERAWQRAAPLLTLKRPRLGHAKLLVTLPENWDKSWLAEGVEQQTANFEGGERAGWLGQLLAVLPPSRWIAHLGVGVEELLALAEATEWSRLLLRAWARAAYLHQDEAFVAPLLLRHFTQPGVLLQPQVTQLAQLLTDAEKLALLRAQLPPHTSEAPAYLPEFLGYLSVPWPADIVAVTVRYLTQVLAPAVANPYAETYQRVATLLSRLARYLPDDQVAQCTDALAPLALAYPLLAPLIEQLLDALRFRQQLAASLTEPSYPS
jgi:hypothetical protein